MKPAGKARRSGGLPEGFLNINLNEPNPPSNVLLFLKNPSLDVYSDSGSKRQRGPESMVLLDLLLSVKNWRIVGKNPRPCEQMILSRSKSRAPYLYKHEVKGKVLEQPAVPQPPVTIVGFFFLQDGPQTLDGIPADCSHHEVTSDLCVFC